MNQHPPDGWPSVFLRGALALACGARLRAFGASMLRLRPCMSLAESLAWVELQSIEGTLPVSSEDASKFAASTLSEFDVVLFRSTTGEVLDDEPQGALRQFIHPAGGFVGVHSATDAEAGWPWSTANLGQLFDCDTEVLSFGSTPQWKSTVAPSVDVDAVAALEHVALGRGLRVPMGLATGSDRPVVWHYKFEGGRLYSLEREGRAMRQALSDLPPRPGFTITAR